jgi:hypothetical protein
LDSTWRGNDQPKSSGGGCLPGAAIADSFGSVFRVFLDEKVAGALALLACVRIEASKKKIPSPILGGIGRDFSAWTAKNSICRVDPFRVDTA